MASTLAGPKPSYLTAEQEADFVKCATALGGKAEALKFVEQVFRLGHSRIQQLLDTSSPIENHVYDIIRFDSNIARPTETTSQTGAKNTVNAPRAVTPVVDMTFYKCPAEVRAGHTNPCNGYRKKLYKTPRGLREHLFRKHGWTELEAEYEAKSVFGAGIQPVTIQHPAQQNTNKTTTYGPQNLYGREEELDSGITASDFDDSIHWNDHFDGWSS